MPIWTAPRTWVAGEVPPAATFNTHVRDNLLWLKDRPTAVYTNYPVSAWTTTSTTFVDLDSTNLKWTIESAGGRFLILARLGMGNANNGESNLFDVTVDGTRQGHTTLGLTGEGRENSSMPDNAFIVFRTAALAAGNHEFRLQGRCTGGTLSLNNLHLTILEL